MVAAHHKYHIRVFQGSAIATPHHLLGYPAGEQRDVIVFVRQEAGKEDDLLALEVLMRRAGWKRAVFSRMLTLSDLPPSVDGDETLRNTYQDAMAHGGALLVCGEVSSEAVL
jgi:hypothetical protein